MTSEPEHHITELTGVYIAPSGEKFDIVFQGPVEMSFEEIQEDPKPVFEGLPIVMIIPPAKVTAILKASQAEDGLLLTLTRKDT